MSKEATKSRSKSAHKEDGIAKVENMLPEGSWQRTALGVTAAAGSGLLLVSLIGVGPVAVAGAAGYLAFRELRKSRRVHHRAATSEG
jgi:hypothetical protein